MPLRSRQPMRLSLSFSFSSLRTKIAIGYGLISVIFLGIGWTHYRLVQQLVQSKNWESHTHEVLERLEAVISDLKDVETGQRGYMLNGQETFLEPYYAGLKAVPQDIRALRHLTKDNFIQLQRINMLESLASKKTAIARMRVEVRRSQGLEASIRVGTFGSGNQTMQNIRWLIQVMKETEVQLLKQRSQQVETALQKAAHLSFVGLGSDLAILLGLYCLINSEITQRQRVADSLYESERRFHALFDQAFQLIGLLATDGTLLEANQTALEVSGIKRSDVIGRPFWEAAWWSHSPELQTRLKAAIAEVAGGQFVRFEAQHPGTGGTTITIDFSLKPVMNETGQVVLLISEGRDISERKQYEEQLRTYAVKLEKVNRELEQFSYIAAHDLKTPLRTITTRLETLPKQLGPLNQKAQYQMSRIALATQRMDWLLSDLTTYSQIGTQTKPLVPIDSSVTLQQALDSLHNEIQASSASVEVEPNLPTVLADFNQLRQVWQNLISNSLKFCRVTPQIKISVTCSQDECTFCLADNGIGIPTKYAQRIFGLFKRLHSQEEYEGTGIGLAIAERILDWHGGRIWVESEESKGSKFFFTLRASRARERAGATDRDSASRI